ncbi:MAG: hypothetical protein M3N19_09030 [Candidatus Eremiobacteraeota bacterium]|nr:hypothetical protein [Candidatus Eremiobacteraeota bacterium]
MTTTPTVYVLSVTVAVPNPPFEMVMGHPPPGVTAVAVTVKDAEDVLVPELYEVADMFSVAYGAQPVAVKVTFPLFVIVFAGEVVPTWTVIVDWDGTGTPGVGVGVGAPVGVDVGAPVGDDVGDDVGVLVGDDVGALVGDDVGALVGDDVGPGLAVAVSDAGGLLSVATPAAAAAAPAAAAVPPPAAPPAPAAPLPPAPPVVPPSDPVGFEGGLPALPIGLAPSFT